MMATHTHTQNKTKHNNKNKDNSQTQTLSPLTDILDMSVPYPFTVSVLALWSPIKTSSFPRPITSQQWLVSVCPTSIDVFTHHGEINPLNAKLNPICHLLALLGAHHILRVSRIKVKMFIGIVKNVLHIT
jgi:hypothetical protein